MDKWKSIISQLMYIANKEELNSKDRIINNLDDIEMTLKYRDEIVNYEDKMKMKKPWLFNDG